MQYPTQDIDGVFGANAAARVRTASTLTGKIPVGEADPAATEP